MPSAVAWTYDVRAQGPTASLLRVEARFAPGASDALGIDPDAAPFVREPQYEMDGQWRTLPRQGDGWRAPCHARPDGCRIRYSFALGEAAAQLDNIETAFASAGIVVAPPSTWLLRPDQGGDADRFQVRVTTERGARFGTAMRPAATGGVVAGRWDSPAADGGTAEQGTGATEDDDRTFEASTRIIDRSSFAVFGAFTFASIRSGDARVQVAYTPPAPGGAAAATQPPDASSSTGASVTAASVPAALSPDDLVAWVERAVSSLSAYYGTFPVPRSLVAILPGHGDETRGETISEGGPAVVIRPAAGLTVQRTRNDWVVTHELIHATLPSFGHRHAWLDEGIATYVEPIVRTRAGLVTVETFWRELVDGLPQGLPEPNDQGLERTHTWGRTYWGGALFCFVADVRIRTATHGVRSFDDVMRALARVPLDDSRRIDVAQFVEVGDRATGTSVLTSLYRELGLAPGTIDLRSLWASLGVHREATGVRFDDAAPLAFVRAGITGPGIAGSD